MTETTVAKEGWPPMELAYVLGNVLAARLNLATQTEAAIPGIIRDLKALGHDLWSYDESDDFSTWGYAGLPPFHDIAARWKGPGGRRQL